MEQFTKLFGTLLALGQLPAPGGSVKEGAARGGTAPA
jgi:hypothetical protein